MTLGFALAAIWAGVLWWIARSTKEAMQLTWLLLLALVLLSPVLAWLWPFLR